MMIPENVKKILAGECDGCEQRRAKLKVLMEKLNAIFRTLGPPDLMGINKIMREMLSIAASPESEIEQEMNIAKKKLDT